MHQYRLKKPVQKEALRERTKDFGRQQVENKSALCPYDEDCHLPVRLQQGDNSLRKMILPVCSALVITIWGGAYSLSSEHVKKHGHSGASPVKDHGLQGTGTSLIRGEAERAEGDKAPGEFYLCV